LPLFGIGMSPVVLLLRCHATPALASARQKANVKSSITDKLDTFLLKRVQPASKTVFFDSLFIDKLL
jgi:hypothetical protein